MEYKRTTEWKKTEEFRETVEYRTPPPEPWSYRRKCPCRRCSDARAAKAVTTFVIVSVLALLGVIISNAFSPEKAQIPWWGAILGSLVSGTMAAISACDD